MSVSERPMSPRSYRDLELWQKAMGLVVECTTATKRFPSAEAYGLISQIQRAAVSVPANVAEGQGRQHRPEFIQHLSIAYGSLAELKTHLQIAQRLNYTEEHEARRLRFRTGEVGRLLNGLLRFLRSRGSRSNAALPGNRSPTTDN